MARYWLCQCEPIPGQTGSRTPADCEPHIKGFCQVAHDSVTLESLMVSTVDLSDCMTEITAQEAGDWLDAHGARVIKEAGEYTKDRVETKPPVMKTGREVLKQWYGWESGQRKP